MVFIGFINVPSTIIELCYILVSTFLMLPFMDIIFFLFIIHKMLLLNIPFKMGRAIVESLKFTILDKIARKASP